MPFAADRRVLGRRHPARFDEARHPIQELGHLALGGGGFLLERAPADDLAEHRQPAGDVGLDAEETRFGRNRAGALPRPRRSR